MKLKIYSDEAYLLQREGIFPHPMLYPFWPHRTEEMTQPWAKKYARYRAIAADLFELTSLADADIAVMPDDWRSVIGEVWYDRPDPVAQDLYGQFAAQAKQANKPLVIFFGSDLSHYDLGLGADFGQNTYVFRHSDYASRRQPRSFIWPAFCEDLIEKYRGGIVTLREQQAKPVVGFCGLVKRNSWKNQLKQLAYHGFMLARRGELGYPPIQGHLLRARILDLLQSSQFIETNFITRSEMVFFGKKDPTQFNQLLNPRLEFVDNLISSDYVVCSRGAGNFSNRLFETLCCGRIPIFINTDCVLPYDFAIDWKKHCVWIEAADINRIAEKVLEFHQSLSADEFQERQRQCRQLWQDWLSPEGFYRNFYRHLPMTSISAPAADS